MNYLIKPMVALTSLMSFGMVHADTGAGTPPMMGAQLPVPKAGVYGLDFDAKNYTVKSIEVNGQTIQYRAFENIVYVTHPVDTKYQRMNVYVPEAYYQGNTP